MKQTNVKQHLRSGKNKKSVIRKHLRNIGDTQYISKTHRVYKGKKQVFVDGFWKHDDYPNAPKESWSHERLIREKLKLQNDLKDGLEGRDILPPRKFGLLTRRIKKINRILKKKSKNGYTV
jgi:hypothetical protein